MATTGRRVTLPRSVMATSTSVSSSRPSRCLTSAGRVSRPLGLMVMVRMARSSRSPSRSEVLQDRVGGAATRGEGAVDGGIVAVVAADVQAGAEADRALGGVEGAGGLGGLGVGDVVGLEVAPGDHAGAEPVGELAEDGGLQVGALGEAGAADHGGGDEGGAGWGVGGGDGAGDAEVVDRALAVAVEDDHRLVDRGPVGGEVEAA